MELKPGKIQENSEMIKIEKDALQTQWRRVHLFHSNLAVAVMGFSNHMEKEYVWATLSLLNKRRKKMFW